MWKTKQWPSNWRYSRHIPILKKRDAKESSNSWDHYYNFRHEQSDPQGDATKASTLYGTRNANCASWIQKRKGCPLIVSIFLDVKCCKECRRKKIGLCIIDYSTACDCVDHEKLREALKEMGVPQHFVILMCNLHCGQDKIQSENSFLEAKVSDKGPF